MAWRRPTLDYDTVAAEGFAFSFERRDRARWDQGSAVAPEAQEFSFLAGHVEVAQIGCVAGCVIGEPLVGFRDAELMQKTQGIAGGFALIVHQRGQLLRANRRIARTAEIEGRGVDVPLDGVTEQVRQKKQALFGRNGVIDVNFDAVEVAGERVRNIAGDDADAVRLLDVVFNLEAIVGERDHACLSSLILAD